MDAATRNFVRRRADNRCNLHPRRDQWDEHFLFRAVRIEGRTPVGRTTVQVLAMNEARR